MNEKFLFKLLKKICLTFHYLNAKIRNMKKNKFLFLTLKTRFSEEKITKQIYFFKYA